MTDPVKQSQNKAKIQYNKDTVAQMQTELEQHRQNLKNTSDFRINFLQRERTQKMKDLEDQINWKKQNNIVLWIFVSIAVVISTIIIYAFGIFRFSVLFPANSFAENLTIVLIPFLPGTLVKSAIAIPFAKKILPTVKNYLE